MSNVVTYLNGKLEDAGLFTRFATVRTTGEPRVIKVGNLEVTRDLSDVRDVARAYLALLTHGQSGAAYNVCSGAGVRLSAAAERLVEAARVPITIEVDPERLRPADVPYLVGDPSKIQRECSWQTEIPLDQTLADVLAAWRAS